MRINKITLKKRFIISTSFTFLTNIVSLVMLYISQVLFARYLGVDQYGIYLFVLSWMAVVGILGKFGLDITLQRFLPEYISNQNWSLSKGLLLNSFLIGIFSGLTLTLIGFLILKFFQSSIENISYQTFLISLLILPVWILNKITQGAFIAFKKPALASIPDGIILPVLLIVVLSIIYFNTNQNISSHIVMTTHVILFAVILGISINLLFRYCLTPNIKEAKSQYKTGMWMRYSIPLLLISGTQVIMNYADIIMIGLILDTTKSGIYAAASRLSTLVTFSLLLVNMVLTPYISEFFHNHRIDDLQKLVTHSTRTASVIAIPISIILFSFGKYFLWLFGEAFVIGHQALIILSIGAIFNVLSGSVGFLMSMTGHQKQAAYFFSVGCILNILLNLILIPIYGIEGAAVATSSSIIIWNLSLAYYLKRKININSTIFAG